MRRPSRRPARSRIVSLQPPIKGLMLNQPPGASDPLGAEVLENGIPTKRGVRVRGGLRKDATVGASPVTSLFAYRTGDAEALFAATASGVFNISGLDPDTAPVASIAGQTAGYYSAQQIGTAGGDYLVAVNGADFAWLYDGAAWNPVTTVAVNQLAYDGLTTGFTKGETLTGGTSGATATILAVIPASATTGVLKLGTITGGPYADNEAITSAGGAAVANGASAAASAVTITGVATTALSHVWLYRSRLFFVQKDTMTAWYLPVDAVGGAVGDVGLAGIFQRGGSLLFGATWSLDSGDGLDDKCVFVSTEGEVAIYEGNDPSDVAAWSLAGRYDVAKPLGVNASMQAGGDLLIATVDGIVPLSQIIQKDPAALSLSAVTRPIESLWNRLTVEASEPVELVKWTDRGLGVVTLPESDRMLLVNLQTGAWGTATGWIANCAETYLGACYIGRDDGSVCAIDETGYDDGEAYTMRLCWAFNDLGDATAYKRAQLVRPSFFAPETPVYQAGIAVDYTADFPTAPANTEVTPSEDYLVWDVGNWDEKLWWSPSVEDQSFGIIAKWRTVTGAGFAMAPTIQITSGQLTKPNIEILRLDIAFETGGSVV
jgi:hypothetical protein